MLPKRLANLSVIQATPAIFFFFYETYGKVHGNFHVPLQQRIGLGKWKFPYTLQGNTCHGIC